MCVVARLALSCGPSWLIQVLGEGPKTYFMYVLRPSILIKSVWFLYHHGGGRVESLVKNDNGPLQGASRQKYGNV